MTTWTSTFLVKQHGMDIKTMGVFAAMSYIIAALPRGWVASWRRRFFRKA
jgi:hypothetical protein